MPGGGPEMTLLTVQVPTSTQPPAQRDVCRYCGRMAPAQFGEGSFAGRRSSEERRCDPATQRLAGSILMQLATMSGDLANRTLDGGPAPESIFSGLQLTCPTAASSIKPCRPYPPFSRRLSMLTISNSRHEAVMCLPAIHMDARMRAYDVAGRGVLLLFVRGATLEPVTTPGWHDPAP